MNQYKVYINSLSYSLLINFIFIIQHLNLLLSIYKIYKIKLKKMSKKNMDKLSELILKKIQEKKEREIANRPRVPVLNVMLENSIRAYRNNIQYKQNLAQELQTENSCSKSMKICLEDLGGVVWQQHMLITLKPEFYASEKIPLAIKQFYRKSANNFLRMSILQKRNLSEHIQKKHTIQQYFEKIKNIQQVTREVLLSHKKSKENQLIENMKQKLRYQDAVQKGKDIQFMIKSRIQQKTTVLKEYEHKKGNMDKMHEKISDLELAIQKQKEKYEAAYNLITYREYLKKLFDVKFKIQSLQIQVNKAYNQSNNIQQKTLQLQQSLMKKNSFTKYGKIQSYARTPRKDSDSSTIDQRSHSQQKSEKQYRSTMKADRNLSANKKNRTFSTNKKDQTFSTSKKTKVSLFNDN